MKTNMLLVMAACSGMLLCANRASAQEEVVVVSEDITTYQALDCKDYYYCDGKDNWFIQLGAGIQSPFVENELKGSGRKHHITAAYNLGFGKFWSPYLGFRIAFQYGAIHWDCEQFSKAQSVSAYGDLMWDMFNTFGGYNPNRVFSIVPFVGIGGTFNWDFYGDENIKQNKSLTARKHNTWTLPVSAGLQFRFRLCKYVDFFVEGRASFHGDNYNNYAYGEPVDVNISAIGGFTIKFGGREFKSYNPCKDAAYIAGLNDQINTLRGQLADCEATAAALAAQPKEVIVADCPETAAPMLSTVRFTINSSKISDEEMVNVYNTAEYMKANPNVNVTIKGYADKDTGTSTYNMGLSERRAQAVYDALTKTYGIDGSRLTIEKFGSDVQPYSTNDWNRIVIFSNGN